MTKKHFISLANYIKQHNNWSTPKFTDEHIETLARFCNDANPRFDKTRWISYVKGECGPNGGTPKTK